MARFAFIGITIMLALAFIALSVVLLVSDFAVTDQTGAAVLLSFAGAFAMFFSTVSIAAIAALKRDDASFLGGRQWLMLAALLLVFGVGCGFHAGHWIALLLPASLAFCCALGDARFREFISIF